MSSMRRASFSETARSLLCALAAMSLPACASLDLTSTYTPPSGDPVVSSLRVEKPYDEAWDGFVRRLSQSYFQVNNISKDSHLINVSLGPIDAAGLTECGLLTYRVNGKTWSFDPAQDATFEDSGFMSDTKIEHRVESRIGRMNIFVAPEGEDALFEVNSSYVLKMEQSGRAVVKNIFGDVNDSESLDERTARFRFTTRSADEELFGEQRIRCRSSGKWERQILDLAR